MVILDVWLILSCISPSPYPNSTIVTIAGVVGGSCAQGAEAKLFYLLEGYPSPLMVWEAVVVVRSCWVLVMVVLYDLWLW